MEFLEKLKDKMFFMNLQSNSFITLTEYSIGLKEELNSDPNFSVIKIGHIFSDFIEIIFIDSNSGNIVQKNFYSTSLIKEILIDYE